eukprot:851099-Lingulodinium_polyedra.AAC.1
MACVPLPCHEQQQCLGVAGLFSCSSEPNQPSVPFRVRERCARCAFRWTIACLLRLGCLKNSAAARGT